MNETKLQLNDEDIKFFQIEDIKDAKDLLKLSSVIERDFQTANQKCSQLENKDIEFIKDTKELFKLSSDYLKWNEKNLHDWFYWIRHKLRFKFPKISKDIIDLRKIDPDNIDIWKEYYGFEAGESMYNEFSLWIKYKNFKSKFNVERKLVGNYQVNKPRRRNEKKDGLYLWQILLTMLIDKRYSKLISWTDYESGMFKIIEPNAVSNIWGESKGNKNMTYDKMSRSMRQYYKSNLLKKTNHDKLNYCFNMDDYSVKKFISRCKDKLPVIRIPPNLH